MRNKIVNIEELQIITQKYRTDGKIIVATSGCFDILHAGHVDYLEKARSFGDVLIVFLNSDDSIRELKGCSRPIVGEMDRALVLAGLECVSFICIFSENTPCMVLSKIRPDTFVKGGDYRDIKPKGT